MTKVLGLVLRALDEDIQKLISFLHQSELYHLVYVKESTNRLYIVEADVSDLEKAIKFQKVEE